MHCVLVKFMLTVCVVGNVESVKTVSSDKGWPVFCTVGVAENSMSVLLFV